jgi:hypothetical protein
MSECECENDVVVVGARCAGAAQERPARNTVVLRYRVGPPSPYLLLTSPIWLWESEAVMAGKAVISLTTGLEDPEKVTVAFLVAVSAAESGGRP